MNVSTSHAPAIPPRRVRIDGSRWVSIRPIDRSDAAGLSDFYDHLSSESRRRRFLGPAGPSRELLDRFTDVGDGFVGVLSEAGSNDGAIVAHASVQADGRGGAEVAFAVADELQGRGLGRMLVEEAIELARRRGFDRATATLYADNAPMRSLLGRAGHPVLVDRIDAGVEEILLSTRRA